MNERVLIINGAIRIEGNTDTLINKTIEGTTDAGLNANLVKLREKNIGHCNGCYQCLEDATCSIQDDMTELRNLIQKVQLLIFASPLYWCGVTGLMKTFLDRLFFYYHPQTKDMISGKSAMIITPLNQMNVVYESEILIEFYTRLLNCLGIKSIDMIFFGDVMTKEDFTSKPQYLKEAYIIGKNLAKLVKNGNHKQQTTRVQIV